MGDRRETAALICLLQGEKSSRAEIIELVELEGSALAVLAGGSRNELTLLDPEPADFDAELSAIEAEIDAWEREGMRILSVLDGGYPANLRSVHDRPALLFVRGSLLDADANSVAVVGTRKASRAALEQAERSAEGLAEAGFTVFSGLAAGVDAAAHRGGAIEAGGRTVAVIGTGLRQSYPKQNADLQRLIGERFAVISQFLPDQPPTRWSFPMRNAVMSGLSHATLVIEASSTSGARIQAKLAIEHGRPVFLMRAVLEHEWARSFAELPGTYVVDDVQEVIEQLEKLKGYEEALALA